MEKPIQLRGESIAVEVWSAYYELLERVELYGNDANMTILNKAIQDVNSFEGVATSLAVSILGKASRAIEAAEIAAGIAALDKAIAIMDEAEEVERTRVVEVLAKAMKIIEASQLAKTPEEITKEVVTSLLTPNGSKKIMSRKDKVKFAAEALSRKTALKIIQNSANSAKDSLK